ncbi:MAG: D-Ala-D-Ala carboxypeptidase family metallohydrolase [Bacteroidales bacterium]
MNVSKNFQLREFVDPVTFQIRGNKAIELIDKRIVNVAQFLRDHFNAPIVINNYHEGGGHIESGLRTFLSKTGATYSQHKYGRAIDIKVQGWKAEEVRKEIRKMWPELKALGLTTIERDTPTWVHLDCRYTGLDELLEVPYK